MNPGNFIAYGAFSLFVACLGYGIYHHPIKPFVMRLYDIWKFREDYEREMREHRAEMEELHAVAVGVAAAQRDMQKWEERKLQSDPLYQRLQGPLFFDPEEWK